MPDLEKRIEELLAEVGLAHRANDMVRTFHEGCSSALP